MKAFYFAGMALLCAGALGQTTYSCTCGSGTAVAATAYQCSPAGQCATSACSLSLPSLGNQVIYPQTDCCSTAGSVLSCTSTAAAPTASPAVSGTVAAGATTITYTSTSTVRTTAAPVTTTVPMDTVSVNMNMNVPDVTSFISNSSLSGVIGAAFASLLNVSASSVSVTLQQAPAGSTRLLAGRALAPGLVQAVVVISAPPAAATTSPAPGSNVTAPRTAAQLAFTIKNFPTSAVESTVNTRLQAAGAPVVKVTTISQPQVTIGGATTTPTPAPSASKGTANSGRRAVAPFAAVATLGALTVARSLLG